MAVNFNDLIIIMEKLRSPEGCPWDREQTHKSIEYALLEECYEVLETIDKDDHKGMCEELGDLLYQIVFQSRMAEEAGHFNVNDVMQGIHDKLVRRHPHVFGDVKVTSSDEVVKNWEQIKQTEKKGKMPLDGIPKTLPALLKAQRTMDKLGRADGRLGEEMKRVRKKECLKNINNLIGGIEGRINADWMGQLLMNLAALSNYEGIDSESALRDALDRKYYSAGSNKEGTL